MNLLRQKSEHERKVFQLNKWVEKLFLFFLMRVVEHEEKSSIFALEKER